MKDTIPSELEKAHAKLADLEAWFNEARGALLLSFHPIHAQVQSFPDESCGLGIRYSPDKREFTPLELEYIPAVLADEKQFFAIVTLEELLKDVRDPQETIIGRVLDEYNRGDFSATIEDIKTANAQQISGNLQFQTVGNQKYFTAVEAVYAALEFLSDRIPHFADLSRKWESVEVKTEQEVSKYYWTVRALMEDLADTITPVVSNGREVQNLFERQKIGYKAWLDQRYCNSQMNKTPFPSMNHVAERAEQTKHVESKYRFKNTQMTEYLGYEGNKVVNSVLDNLNIPRAGRGVKSTDFSMNQVIQVFEAIADDSSKYDVNRSRARIFLDNPDSCAKEYFTNKSNHLEYLDSESQSRVMQNRKKRTETP